MDTDSIIQLIAGYVITLLMLVLLTYFMRKFILDEKAVDNIIFGIYVAGSFTGAMLSAWMIKKRRVVTGIIYGAVYITYPAIRDLTIFLI